VSASEPLGTLLAMPGAPRTRYAKSGELNIAYQVFGAGAFDLVFVPGFVSHLDLAWEDPGRSEVAARWGSFARVIEFDKRNTGLSDRTTSVPTLEERMDDIRAVMDAAGSERAAIMAYSEGGPLAMLFAATYPERVSALVLGATWHVAVDRPDLEAQLDLVERYWGSGTVMQFFDPSVDREWAARYERSSATPRGAAEILRLNARTDVRAAVDVIRVPTLVLHRTGDPVVPIEAGRDLAAAIEGARLVELAGDSHLPTTVEEWHAECNIVEEFLTGEVRSVEPDRVLATVLFTDVVDSTGRAARIGDAKWRAELERLESEATRLLRQHRGTLVKSTGDGVLATFDGPARAVRCAAAVVERAELLGVEIRAGLHTGEVEVRSADIAGIAVHLAKRVESAAAPSTVWVSQTVRDLVTGSGIEFIDRGTHELKGVPGEWRLYEVAGT
jgi:class 3 adenylate cyclase